MLAVDTNIVVRYLAGDDPTQSGLAKTLIDGDVFVSMTVIMETEWVLRSVYEVDARRCAKIVRDFAGLPTVTLEDAASVAQALDWMDGGMDFADALHLVKAKNCEALMSFDRRFAKVAKRLGTLPVRLP